MKWDREDKASSIDHKKRQRASKVSGIVQHAFKATKYRKYPILDQDDADDDTTLMSESLLKLLHKLVIQLCRYGNLDLDNCSEIGT